MAVASLTKMTVPLAGGQSATAQGLLMPKLKYRFRASFLNFGVSTNVVELTKQVQTIKRPSVQFGDLTIDVYNSKVKLIGKPEWQDLTIKLRDDAGGNVAKLVGEQMQKQFDFMEQASAASGIDYKFQLNYEMLDGGNGANQPNILETWEIYGAFISQVDYGEFDYASNEHATIDLTIKYDNALQSPTGTGIGTAVARTIGATITG
jgi:hypothetical protein